MNVPATFVVRFVVRVPDVFWTYNIDEIWSYHIQKFAKINVYYANERRDDIKWSLPKSNSLSLACFLDNIGDLHGNATLPFAFICGFHEGVQFDRFFGRNRYFSGSEKADDFHE